MYYEGRELIGGSSSTISDDVMSSFKEIYNVQEMGNHINTFENLVKGYEDKTREIDDIVTSTIGEDGLKGNYADKLLIMYDDLVKDFADFTRNYEAINNVIIVEDSLHTNFAAEAAEIYKDTGTDAGQKPGLPYQDKPNYIRPTIPGTTVNNPIQEKNL